MNYLISVLSFQFYSLMARILSMFSLSADIHSETLDMPRATRGVLYSLRPLSAVAAVHFLCLRTCQLGNPGQCHVIVS